MSVEGLTGDAGKLVSVDYGDGGITVPYSISRTKIGNNDYMEWGYWTQNCPYAMPDTYGDNNWVNNTGYYITGDNTPDISSLNPVFTYSGGAEGTYWTACGSGGGINMTGTFSANVDFGATSSQISDFDLYVSGGGHNVAITNATGSFDGGGSSEFTLKVGQE